MEREAIALGPVLVPARVNDAALLVLVDQDGSMAPFHGLVRRLLHTATRGGKLAHLDVFHFHNCPVDHVYRDADLVDGISLSSALDAAARRRPSVMIVSDAGAARRGYSEDRLEQTRSLLHLLHARFRKIAWVNPVPRSRWRRTTADGIRSSVAMFELTAAGMNAAVRALRGRRPWRDAGIV
jgi:uncharacterized protein with von Willebrand factor type A (vWA) domain